MFPLNNIYQHFSHTLEKNTSESIDHDYQNPNSSNHEDHHDHDQQYSTFPYSNFPTTFEDDGLLLSHLLSQQQLILAGNTSHSNSQAHTTDEISVVASNQAVLDHHHLQKPSHDENLSKLGFSKKKQRAKVLQTMIPRRRTGKKDRHSKISTAQGLRDRRMRLSLQIARKFFDLQDMLGFDKASKTIEWLITKSKTAIKELKDSLVKQSCTTSSTSEGEVVSKTAEKEDNNNDDDDDDDHNQSSLHLRKEKKIRKLHKVIARESREKARARARERTREKHLEKSRQSTTTSTNDQAANDINTSVDLGKSRPNSSTSLEKGDSTQKEILNSSLKMVDSSRFDQEPRSSDQLLDYSISNHIGVSSGANSEDDFLGFPGVMRNVRAQNPCPIFTTTLSSDAEEQKPSSFFPMTTTSNPQRESPSSNFVTTSTGTQVDVNPSSVFMASSTSGCNYAAEEQNPKSIFVSDSNIVHQEQNPSSNFLMGTTNIFCSLNF